MEQLANFFKNLSAKKGKLTSFTITCFSSTITLTS